MKMALSQMHELQDAMEFSSEYRLIGIGWDIHYFNSPVSKRKGITVHTDDFHVYISNPKLNYINSKKNPHAEISGDGRAVIRFFLQ